jgi:DNA-binding NarL/FixJ family response regulator
MFTAVIADDHPLINEAIRSLLERAGDFKILAECTDGQAALSVVLELRPDMLIIDLDLPLLDGVEVISALRRDYGSIAILVVSAGDELVGGVRAFRAGADGFVHKRTVLDDIVIAARLAARGMVYFSRDIMVAAAASPVAPRKADNPFAMLGRRELEVFRCLALGMPNIDISRRMGISNKTVSAHKRNVMEKLGLTNIRDVIDLARSHRVID